MPLIPFQALAGFRDYQPDPRLVGLGQGDNRWLKTLSTRLAAQQVRDFATLEEDQLHLTMLRFRINSLIYYANIAALLTNGENSTLHVIRQNVQALQKIYQTFLQEVTDDSYRSYLLVLNARLDNTLLLLDILIPILEEGRSFTPEAALAQLERSLDQYRKTEQQAVLCTYNPLYTVPLQQGIQKDMAVIQLIYVIIKCYMVIPQTDSVDFRAFYAQTLQYAYSLTTIQSSGQLLGLLDSLQRMLAARAGTAPLPVINEWSWLQAVLEANIRKSVFGPTETIGTVTRHLHPYWIATLNYAEKQGVIFKSGMGRSALIFADATTNETLVGCLLTNDPLLPIINQGLNNYNLLDQEMMSVPALVSRERAEQMMKHYTNQRASELGTTNVKMLGVVYLPVAHVQYNGKNQQRTMLISRLNVVNQHLGQVLAQTYHFLQQYR